jgi:Mrp family chromosome partitioning ATPase
VAVLVLGGVLVFTLAVSAEARRPTIAHAREAERSTGVPVLAVAEGARFPREGRARLQSGPDTDPIRMVYLALTASGTRERTVCVTGDDPDLVGAVAGRLAVSSAADDRATVLVDLAPGVATATKYFAERSEPGFTEAIAGVRLWREVARPVGASEGLGVDVVPAGARRQDTAESAALAANRDEFQLFASEYDFTVLAAPTDAAVTLAAVLCTRPATVFVARLAVTTLSSLRAKIGLLKQADVELYGMILVDTKAAKT